MRVALTSSNRAKKEAVRKVFFTTFRCDVDVLSVVSKSCISETPSTDNEALQGCRKRMRKIKSTEYEYIVSLEGLAQEYNYGWFVYGIAVVLDCTNLREGIGCSAKVQIPKKLSRLIRSDIKLNELTKQIYSKEKTKHLDLLGTNGVITNGMFTRVDEFEGALRCALGFVLNEENFRFTT